MLILNIAIRASEVSSEQSTPFSAGTGQSLGRYLSSRSNAKVGDMLFVTKANRPIDRSGLLKLLPRMGKRAEVKDAHPRRFRHRFAIQNLRNGGDAYTLQALLGHSTLDMVKTYLRLAQVDLDEAHRRARPVDNWGL